MYKVKYMSIALGEILHQILPRWRSLRFAESNNANL